MKTDLYTKVLLGIIAAALMVQIIQRQTESNRTKGNGVVKLNEPILVTLDGVSASAALNVNIVGVRDHVSFPVETRPASTLDVNVETVNGRYLGLVEHQEALPVRIVPDPATENLNIRRTPPRR